MSENTENDTRWTRWGGAAAAVWILGVTAVYFVRFSVAFYRDNQDAINGLLEKLGLGFMVS